MFVEKCPQVLLAMAIAITDRNAYERQPISINLKYSSAVNHLKEIDGKWVCVWQINNKQAKENVTDARLSYHIHTYNEKTFFYCSISIRYPTRMCFFCPHRQKSKNKNIIFSKIKASTCLAHILKYTHVHVRTKHISGSSNFISFSFRQSFHYIWDMHVVQEPIKIWPNAADRQRLCVCVLNHFNG